MKVALSIKTICLITFQLICHSICSGQGKDSTYIEGVKSTKAFKKLMGLITTQPKTDLTLFNVKSEDPFLKYEGKIIRKINVKQLGFEKTVVDTTWSIKSFVSNVANKVHTDTHETVIRNNLFVRAGKPLNPYRLADNERALRNLDFILDARIYVKTTSNSDSVDLLIITRDVFSLRFSFSSQIPKKYKMNITNINVAGYGQQIELTQLLDQDRVPKYGYQLLYKVNNISGSFLDATLSYTKLNNGISIGNENERSIYFRLSRPLYQPFARFAGSIEVGDNLSRNVYNSPDSVFIQYHYSIQDYWMGYSFGHKHLPNDLKENRNRKFVALRSVEQRFIGPIKAELTEPDRFAYRNRLAFLAQFSLFRQDFYKTQYVTGFGRTEDIPYGYRISFTTGWERELGNQRPYLGSELNLNKVLSSGTLLSYHFAIGGYWKDQGVEDGLLSLNFTRYSKIQKLRKLIIRHRSEAGYSILFNQNVKRGFDIVDLNGIVGFKPYNLIGLQRLTLRQEATIFTPLKLIGFRIAPVAGIDLALLETMPGLFKLTNFYSGYSLGLLAHNQNLILKTIEARIFYYPKTVELVPHLRLDITTNFRIRYPTNLVNKPAAVFP